MTLMTSEYDNSSDFGDSNDSRQFNDSSEFKDFSDSSESNDSSDSNDFSMYSLYVGNIFIPVLCLKAYKKLDNLHSSKKFLLSVKILRALLLLQYHAPSFEMLLPLLQQILNLIQFNDKKNYEANKVFSINEINHVAIHRVLKKN